MVMHMPKIHLKDVLRSGKGYTHDMYVCGYERGLKIIIIVGTNQRKRGYRTENVWIQIKDLVQFRVIHVYSRALGKIMRITLRKCEILERNDRITN